MDKLRKTELSILGHLLNKHIEDGSYFGRKDQHYKMCEELYNKVLKELNLFK